MLFHFSPISSKVFPFVSGIKGIKNSETILTVKNIKNGNDSLFKFITGLIFENCLKIAEMMINKRRIIVPLFIFF